MFPGTCPRVSCPRVSLSPCFHDFLKQRDVLARINWSDTIQRLHDFEEVTLEFGKSMDALMKAGLRRLDKLFK